MIEASDSSTSVEGVYRTERLALARLAFVLTGDWGTAEDVVHTVFAEAQPRWSSIDRPGPYLRRAVANRAYDHLRRRLRSMPSEPERVVPAPEVDETWEALQRLTTRQRTVVVLRFYEDLAIDDIGAVLGLPAGTVRSDLHRALTKLRDELT